MGELFEDHDTSFRGVVSRLLAALGEDLDDHPGSVVRTIIEAFGRELATFYAMLDRAHRAGYVDTAEGPALDRVVAILGITRAQAGRLTGVIELARTSPAPQEIAIPAGFRVTGRLADGSPLPTFETVEDVVLGRGATRVRAAIQELPVEDAAAAPPALLVGPGALTIMPRPALGIESISNPEPLRRSAESEGDEHLRARARDTLRRSQVGTLDAIVAAIAEAGLERVDLVEDREGPPGVVDVLIGDDTFEGDVEAQARVQEALRRSKAAGVRVRVHALQTVFVQPTLVITPADPNLDDAGFRRLADELARALAASIAASPRGRAVERRRIEAVAFAHHGIVSAELRRLDAHTLDQGAIRPRPATLERGVAIGERERGVVDLERWPPRIARASAPLRELDAVVAAPLGVTHELLRGALEGALRSFGERMRRSAGGESPELLALLDEALRPLAAEVKAPVELLELLVTDELGACRRIARGDRLDAIIGDARTILGAVTLAGSRPGSAGP